MKIKQGVQGIHAFAFSIVTVNNGHTKSMLKRNHRG